MSLIWGKAAFVTLAMLGAAIGAGLSPAQAQPPAHGEEVSADQLITLLRPGGQARGIRPPALGSLSPLLQQQSAPPGVSAATLYVLFGAGSATLTVGAERTLDQLGRALVSPVLAGYRFRIEGHTDGPGVHEQNVMLSARRAEAVRDYLVSRFGMDPRQFDVAGLGASQPLVPTTTATPEPLNRRVQVVNLGR